jgi:hypothetical protein
MLFSFTHRTRRVCENSNMGIGQNQIHRNLSLNSFPQAKQCKWSQIGSWTYIKLTLDSHGLNFERGTIFLHIIYFGVVNGDYIEMVKIPQSLKIDLQSLNCVPTLWSIKSPSKHVYFEHKRLITLLILSRFVQRAKDILIWKWFDPPNCWNSGQMSFWKFDYQPIFQRKLPLHMINCLMWPN